MELWICPKCGRQFERKGQTHSCRSFPLEQHFNGKDIGKILYEKFQTAIENRLGSFKIESLECCIHFVTTSTFAAVKIFKDKIRVDFSLSQKMENERANLVTQMSAHRYLYSVEITDEDEIDGELIEWIWEAYNKE
jgi:hypothetical protein